MTETTINFQALNLSFLDVYTILVNAPGTAKNASFNYNYALYRQKRQRFKDGPKQVNNFFETG